MSREVTGKLLLWNLALTVCVAANSLLTMLLIFKAICGLYCSHFLFVRLAACLAIKDQYIMITRNAWQSLAYGPLGAIVSPPSEYL